MRSGKLNVIQKFPFAAETNPEDLVASFITPNRDMFVRSSNLIPSRVDLNEFEFFLLDSDKEIGMYTMEDLKQLKLHKVMFAMSCSGNRRS